MKGSAPNSPLTGFHVLVRQKWKPNFCSDSHDDQPMGRAERALDYSRLFADAARKSEKPHYLMNMRPGVMRREQVRLR